MTFMDKNYNFHIDIECHNFFQRIKIFLSYKILKQKHRATSIKCVLKNSDYVDQPDKTVHFMSNFLHCP